MGDLLALPKVKDSGDGIRYCEENGCALVGSVDVKAAENYLCVSKFLLLISSKLGRGFVLACPSCAIFVDDFKFWLRYFRKTESGMLGADIDTGEFRGRGEQS